MTYNNILLAENPGQDDWQWQAEKVQEQAGEQAAAGDDAGDESELSDNEVSWDEEERVGGSEQPWPASSDESESDSSTKKKQV